MVGNGAQIRKGKGNGENMAVDAEKLLMAAEAVKFTKLDEEDKVLNPTPGVPFYRCTLCGCVVSVWDIKESKGCPKCASPRIKPSNLSLFEKIVQIIKHPKIWEWKQYAR